MGEDDDGQRSEHYDSDESEDDVITRDEDGNVNSQLAVGYKHDRSFVVRGSKIGVFKHTPDNHLEFSTNISKVETPNGKLFSPKKVMLHAEDTNMILQNEADPNSLYRMDLEYGKIVDEWKVHDDIPVNTFAPESKFAQMSGEQTFLGLSRNALYRIDPRLAGNKLVDSELMQYVSKNDFSAAATTVISECSTDLASTRRHTFPHLVNRSSVLMLVLMVVGFWLLAAHICSSSTHCKRTARMKESLVSRSPLARTRSHSLVVLASLHLTSRNSSTRLEQPCPSHPRASILEKV